MVVPEAVEDLIAGAPLMAQLATSVDDRPHVAPVWYAYEDETISVITGGRKLENARRNPRVAVCIEQSADGDAQWMALLRGTASVVEDSDRINDGARRIFPKYLGPDEDTWAPEYRQDLTGNPTGTLLEIAIGSATCTRF